ncbi:MAG: serine/threonine-protein kinase [Nitrospirae bacterium]|nr:MAG: serine/threonine-protein kinase [Nitrospirota bacterium]
MIGTSDNGKTIVEGTEKTVREKSDRAISETGRTVIENERTVVERSRHETRDLRLKAFRGRSVIEEYPAAGGEADIYLIDDNGKKNILKLYRYGMNPPGEILKKAKQLSDLSPEHIIRIDECGLDEKTQRWFELMEYAAHGSLKDFVKGKPDEKTVRTIIGEILEGLKVIHDNNILHLDLKPSNILVRNPDPLDLVFADFGISSMLDPELSRKMTTVKGTPLYWSSEAFTGVVGKEADYWSLGIIILEFLMGRHPFSGIDTKVIMFTLATKGVSIPEDIPVDFFNLTRGLLTRDPHARWGYNEVKRWLDGDRNVPVYYVPEVRTGKKFRLPYKFRERDFYSFEDLVGSFLESEEAWRDAKEHLYNEYIAKWLERMEDYDTAVRTINARKEAKDDMDLVVMTLACGLNKELPFILYGKLISAKNLSIYIGKALRKENTPAELALVEKLINGKLRGYFEQYLKLTTRKDNELLAILKAIESRSPRIYVQEKKYEGALKLLDLFVNPDSYMLPHAFWDDLYLQPELLALNPDAFFSKDRYSEILSDYVISGPLKENIGKCLTSGHTAEYIKTAGLLTRLIEINHIISRDELRRLEEEYLIPETLRGDILDGGPSEYSGSIFAFRELQRAELLIKKSDFDNYAEKYYGILENMLHISKANTGVKNSAANRAQGSLADRLCMLSKEEYTKISLYIKNRVDLKIRPMMNKIKDRLIKEHPPDLMYMVRYIDALKSGEIKWDVMDKEILNEVYAKLFGLADEDAPITEAPVIGFLLKSLLGDRIEETPFGDTLRMKYETRFDDVLQGRW